MGWFVGLESAGGRPEIAIVDELVACGGGGRTGQWRWCDLQRGCLDWMGCRHGAMAPAKKEGGLMLSR